MRGGGGCDLLHLDDHRRHVAEPPRGAGGEVATVERRRELHRTEQQLARAPERLAREPSLAGVLEHARGLLRELLRSRPLELGEQPSRLVEVEGANLDELVPGALLQPGGEVAVELRARRL